MRRFLIPAIAAAGLATVSVAACDHLSPTTSSTVATVQVRADQGMYIAEAAFKGATIALETATDAGVLKGQSAATANKAYAKAHTALLTARAAKTAADQALAVGQVLSAVATVQKLSAPAG